MAATKIAKIEALEPFTDVVLLYEVDSDHPDGVAYIVSKERDGRPQGPVALTGAVQELVRAGRIKVVEETKSDDTPATSAREPISRGLDANELNAYTLTEIREYAAAIDLDPSAYGKKADLVSAVVEAERAEA